MRDAGNETRWTYDGRGNKATETDPTGAVTRWSYDTMGRVRTETRSRTDSNGQLLEMVTGHDYDGNGRLLETRAPDGSTHKRTYIATGKVKWEYDALGRITQHAQDALDRARGRARSSGKSCPWH